MKKRKLIFILNLLLLASCNSKLPLPEIMDGYLGKEFGVDKNINMETIDKYLNRDDVCYKDMRMLIDPAKYENIGGDSNLSGFINGFEIVPYPFLAPTFDLPSEVGEGYKGDTLFSFINNEYHPNYNESLNILEDLFPKDLKIFLMCGGGGYASMTKNLLVSLGWNKDNIYNIGGYWNYNGKNNINVKYIDNEGKVNYDFSKVNYYEINFAKLTKK